MGPEETIAIILVESHGLVILLWKVGALNFIKNPERTNDSCGCDRIPGRLQFCTGEKAAALHKLKE